MEKAIELLYSAIPLLYQNKESSINETTIHNLIGSLYIQAEQIEKGVEILKKNNISGINSDTIGLTYARMKRPEDAKNYLYQAYMDTINSTLSTTFGMILMFAEQKNEKYKEAATFLLNYLENLVVDKEKVTFIYKFKGILFAELALISAKFQRYDEAENYITEACQYALRFDAKPNYLPQDIKLLKDEDVPALLLDGLGETAILAIENFVFNKEEPSEALDFVKKRFEELKHEGING